MSHSVKSSRTWTRVIPWAMAMLVAGCVGVDSKVQRLAGKRKGGDDGYNFATTQVVRDRNWAIVMGTNNTINFKSLYKFANATYGADYFGGANKVLLQAREGWELDQVRRYNLMQDTVPLEDLIYPVSELCAERGFAPASYTTIRNCLEEAMSASDILVFEVNHSRSGTVYAANTVGRAIEDVVDHLWGATTGILQQKRLNASSGWLENYTPPGTGPTTNLKVVQLACVSCHSTVTSVKAADGQVAVQLDPAGGFYVTSTNNMGYTIQELFLEAEERANATSINGVEFSKLLAKDQAYLNAKKRRKAAAALAKYYRNQIQQPYGHHFRATEADLRAYAKKADAIKGQTRGAILGFATAAGAACSATSTDPFCHSPGMESTFSMSLESMLKSTTRVSAEHMFTPTGDRFNFTAGLFGARPWDQVPLSPARTFLAPPSAADADSEFGLNNLFVAPFAHGSFNSDYGVPMQDKSRGMLMGITSIYAHFPNTIPSAILTEFGVTMDDIYNYLPRAMDYTSAGGAPNYFKSRFRPEKSFDSVNPKFMPTLSQAQLKDALGNLESKCLTCHSTTNVTIKGMSSNWGALDLSNSTNCGPDGKSCAEFLAVQLWAANGGDTASDLTDFLGGLFALRDRHGQPMSVSKPFAYGMTNVSLSQPSDVLVSARRNLPFMRQMWGDISPRHALLAMKGVKPRKRLEVVSHPLDLIGDPVVQATSTDLSDAARDQLMATYSKLPVETGQFFHPDISSSLSGMSDQQVRNLATLIAGVLGDGINVQVSSTKTVSLVRKGCYWEKDMSGYTNGEMIMYCGAVGDGYTPDGQMQSNSLYDGGVQNINHVTNKPNWPVPAVDAASFSCLTMDYDCSYSCQRYPQYDNKCMASDGSGGGGDPYDPGTGGGSDPDPYQPPASPPPSVSGSPSPSSGSYGTSYPSSSPSPSPSSGYY